MIVREPVGPVQVGPPGLLNLLQLKSGGTNPDAMRQDIAPSIDLEQWWLRATRKRILDPYGLTLGAGSYGVVAQMISIPGGAPLGPTDREWWYVHATYWVANLGAASSLDFAQVGIIENGGPLFVTSTLYGDLLQGVGADTAAPVSARGLWMPPGSSLGIFTGTVVGNMDYQMRGFVYSVLPL